MSCNPTMGAKMKRMLALVLAATSLSACASVERLRPDIEAKPVPSRLDEIAYINSLRRAYTYRAGEGDDPDNCYRGGDLGRFNPELSEGYALHDDEHERVSPGTCVFFRRLGDDKVRPAILDYLDAGFGLTDIYCQRFFIVASQAAQKRRFERDTGTTVDGLVGAVLGFANASKNALEIVNAGFAAIDSTFKNIDEAFLVGPDLGNVRKLVQAAQADFRTEVFSKPDKLPNSYAGARSIVERYAGLCSFTGMKQMVNVSVQSQTKALTDSAEAPKPPAGKPPAAPAPGKSPAVAPAVGPTPVTPSRPPAAETVPATAPK